MLYRIKVYFFTLVLVLYERRLHLKTLNYVLLDVFTDKPFGGNQLAVFLNGSGLTTAQMQTIARELNLSETVFLFPPSRGTQRYKLRIFTPSLELPFAGHPTIGTAFLLGEMGLVDLKDGITPITVIENIGFITIHLYAKNKKVLKADMFQPIPETVQRGEVDANHAASLLSLAKEDLHPSLPIETLSAGIPFLYVPVNTIEAMNRIQFRMDVWQELFSKDENKRHIFAFALRTEQLDTHVHSRMFAPAMGIAEDPATGSASGPLGYYLVNNGLVQHKGGQYLISSEQGIEMGRPSKIEVTIQKRGDLITDIMVGGFALIVGKGELRLPI
jgi:trans-2,3-dihydro-3-hydroxyanthranilate isomerase